ncbi:MAG TPA: hypothetical protein VGO48_09155 [Conexibacter sp.]|jgi:hypothetical protein|nr:hypothetical protein [Conexibacter sp.]
MKRIHILKRLCWGLALAMLLGAAGASSAVAAPVVRISMLKPDYVTPGRYMVMFINVMNVSNEPLSGNLTIRYTFPPEIAVSDPAADGSPSPTCTQSGQVDECVMDVSSVPLGRTLNYQTLTPVDPSATGTLTGEIEVSGGGLSSPITVPLSFNTDPIGPFDVKDFTTGIKDDPNQDPAQAGSNPTDVTTAVELPSESVSNQDIPFFSGVAPSENFRDVVVHVPPGFVGNPTATQVRCTVAQLSEPSPSGQVPICPRDSQIGNALINGKDVVPIYNLVPPRGTPAEFGFYYQGLIVYLQAKLRPSDNGIDIVAARAPSAVPIPKFEVALWGVPTASAYDGVRAECTELLFGASGRLCPSEATREAFLRMPTSCGDPLTWSMDMNTYQQPEKFFHREVTTPAVTGCDLNPFDPSLEFVPSTLAPHASSGVKTVLSMPQEFGPHGIAPADIRRVSVELPAGMSINPSSGDGLRGCADSDLKLRQEGAATCDPASKIGTVTVRTPLLDHEIGGSVFVRTQDSDDPLSGRLFRIAIELRSDDDGIDIKLPGSIIANPVRGEPRSGQLTTVFDDLPQLPFDSMTLQFKTGSRAPLASPSACGVHTTEVDFLSWGNRPLHSSSSFVTSGCKAPQFAPTWRAGIDNPAAGSSSPFRVVLSRTDDDQEFSSLTVNPPKGLLARVKDAQQCSNDAANAGNCPAGSLIGHATVGAGVGSTPFFVTNGRVYLTTSYRGAPYGLAVVVDAIAGPFNLGTVVVRQAINVDQRTAQLSVVSDPFPTIQKGVLLHIRSVRVAVDKSHFMVAPTNCSKQAVGAVATSVEGRTAPLTSRFQVGNCKNLKFAPKLSLSVGSRGHTRRGNSTPFTAVLSQTPGQSNLKSVSVSLPQTLAALLPVVNRACTLAEYQAGRCAKAQAGSAVAQTPLLKDPLKGGAFFVRHPGRPLPDLMVRLRGDIALDLVGRVTIPGGTRLATHFDAIPDAPVSKFTLSIVAGSHGPLGVSTNLCSRRGLRSPADVELIGQNGAVITQSKRLHVKGCVNKHPR